MLREIRRTLPASIEWLLDICKIPFDEAISKAPAAAIYSAGMYMTDPKNWSKEAI